MHESHRFFLFLFLRSSLLRARDDTNKPGFRVNLVSIPDSRRKFVEDAILRRHPLLRFKQVASGSVINFDYVVETSEGVEMAVRACAQQRGIIRIEEGKYLSPSRIPFT